MKRKKKEAPIWHEGKVEPAGEHILLSIEAESGASEWIPVARLALDQGLTFKVQFLLAPRKEDDSARSMLVEVRHELDLQLRGDYPLEV